MATSHINPDIPAGLEDLRLSALEIVDGLMFGLHRSPHVGYGHEFASCRPYVPGDNLRHVDWKLWSRTDKWYVKQFEDETNLSGYIFLDASGSMDVGAETSHKYTYGRKFAAALIHLMARQRDNPGIIIWNERDVFHIPPRSSRHQVEIWTMLASVHPKGLSGLPDELRQLLEQLHRRGIAVVISDFLAENYEAVELCHLLRAYRQEVIAFQLLCPEECDLAFEDESIFVDNETGAELPVEPAAARAIYRKNFDAFCQEVETRCQETGADFHRIRTDQPVEEALRTYLLKRECLIN